MGDRRLRPELLPPFSNSTICGCCNYGPDGSRRGITYGRFDELAAAIATDVTVPSVVLDGEIVCLDGAGQPRFYDLMFRRGTPCFVAFDCLAVAFPVTGRACAKTAQQIGRSTLDIANRLRYL